MTPEQKPKTYNGFLRPQQDEARLAISESGPARKRAVQLRALVEEINTLVKNAPRTMVSNICENDFTLIERTIDGKPINKIPTQYRVMLGINAESEHAYVRTSVETVEQLGGIKELARPRHFSFSGNELKMNDRLISFLSHEMPGIIKDLSKVIDMVKKEEPITQLAALIYKSE